MTLEKTLRATIITGLFAIPFLVLVVADSMFFPYIVGKNFGFRIIVEIIFVAWALLALINTEYRPHKSAILISVAAFIGIVALADIFGANPYKSFWSNFERMEGLVTLLHLLAYTVVWGTVLNTRTLRVWFWRVALGVSVAVSIHALGQFLFTDATRIAGTLGNPIYLAVYALFHIFIAAIFALRRTAGFGERFIMASIIFIELAVLYLTATRGATLGLIGGMLLAAAGIALTEKENWQLKKLAAGTVLTVLVLVSGFLVIRNSEFVQTSPVLSRFAHISLTEGTVMARTYVWGMATKGVKEHPLLGWGQENYSLVFNTHYDPRMYAQEQWFDRTHNIIFDWLIAAGILGLLAYISIFLALLWTLYKMPHGFGNPAQKWLMVGLLAAYSFHNLTVFDNIVSYILFFSVLAWIYAMSQEGKEEKISNFKFQISNFVLSKDIALKVGAPIAIVFTFGLIWFTNAGAYQANKVLLGALSNVVNANALANAGRVEDGVVRVESAIADFKKAEDYNSYGTQEVREHLVQHTSALVKSKWVPQDLKKEYFDAGVAAMEAQKKVAPHDARFPLFLAGLYEAAGQYEREQEELASARALSPTKQTIILKQGLNAFNLGEIESSLAYFKEAHELDKTYPQAAALYARALAETGQEEEAQKIIESLQNRLAPQK